MKIDTVSSKSIIISKSVQQLARRIRNEWCKHQPVASSLLVSSPILDAAEDLSEVGLNAWISCLNTLAKETHLVRQRAVNVIDQALCDELERFIEEHLYQTEVLRPFCSQVRPYLQLIGAGLLPFTIFEENSRELCAFLSRRLWAITLWLEHGMQRFREGQLSFMPFDARKAPHLSDAHAARHMAAAIDMLVKRWVAAEKDSEGDTGELQKVGEIVRSRLAEWSIQLQANPPSIKMTKPRSTDNLERLLKRALGIKQSLPALTQLLCEQLDEEIEFLNASQERGATLSELLHSNEVPDANSTLLCVELNRDNLIDWLTEIYDYLRQIATGTILADTASPAKIEVATPIAEILIDGPGCFLTFPTKLGASTTPIGRFLIAPRGYPLPQSFRNKMEWILMVAHELCPGHYEHFSRSSRSPLAPYLDIIRAPTGFEGWAVYAEEIICSFGPSAEVILHHNRIRRLLPVVSVLLCFERGRDEANTVFNKLIRRIRGMPQDRWELLPLWWVASPIYGIGLVEVKRALEKLGKAINCSAEGVVINELFLAQGPVTPESVMRLVSLNSPA